METAWAPRQVPYYPPGFDYRVSRTGRPRQVTEDFVLKAPLETQPGFYSKEDAIALAKYCNDNGATGVIAYG